MAPKMQQAFVAKVVRSERVPLNQLSTSDESGWREIEPDRVRELVDMVKDPFVCMCLVRVRVRTRVRANVFLYVYIYTYN